MEGEIITVVVEGLQVRYGVAEIFGDGASMFWSLCYLLYGNISMAAQVGAYIVSHVTNDWQRFRCFTMDRSGTPYGTERLYLAGMDGRLIATLGKPINTRDKMCFNGHFNEGHFDVLIPVDSTNLPNVDAIASETTLSPCTVELAQPAPELED